MCIRDRVEAAPARRAAAEKAMEEMRLEAEYQEAKRQIQERERVEKEAKLRRQYEANAGSFSLSGSPAYTSR